jgi:hypothetical protein
MAGLGVSSSTTWLVDSGASHHVCSDRAMSNSLRESSVKSVLTANHGVTSVKGQGDVQLRVRVHGSSKVVKVCDVLYVPGFVANLLSGIGAGQYGIGSCVRLDRVGVLIIDLVRVVCDLCMVHTMY